MNLSFRIAAIVFILAGCLLIGCRAAEPAPAPTEAPTPLPTTAPTATLPPAPTTAPTQAELPTEWNGIPVFPDALTAQEDMGDLRMTIAALPLRITTFYNQEMPKLGWKLDESMTAGSSDLVFVKDDTYAFFRIIPADGNNEVDVHLVKQE